MSSASELPFVSVVVPTRDRAELLGDCLSSLAAQEYPIERYEVIVVDDGSRDQTPEVVQTMKAQASGPPLSCVRPGGRGANAARNAGLRKARGDPIAFVDDDVLVPPTWLGSLVAGALRHPAAGCLGGPIRLRLEGKPPRLCERDRLGEGELDYGAVERRVELVFGGNMAVRRVAVNQIGFFNEVLAGYDEEVEWELRLRAAGGQIVYAPGAWVWHRRSALRLRPSALIKSRFVRGRCFARSARHVGRKVSVAGALARAVQGMAHALRNRCWGGLFESAFAFGTAAEATRRLVGGVREPNFSWLPRRRST